MLFALQLLLEWKDANGTETGKKSNMRETKQPHTWEMGNRGGGFQNICYFEHDDSELKYRYCDFSMCC